MGSASTLTAGYIADVTGGALRGPPDFVIAGIAPLDRAGPGDLSFLTTGRYLPAFVASRAGAVLVPPRFADTPDGPHVRVVVASPSHALKIVIDALHPPKPTPWGIAPTASIGPGTTWEERIAIGAGAHVGAGVRFGRGCRVDALAVVGAGVSVGDGCRIGYQATVEEGTTLGRGVIVGPGARVGSPGFGYVPGAGGHEPIAHVGRCVIGDDVEIGANTTIDRGGVGDTIVGRGTKIDNLVQIAHHVRVGERCLIMAQVGVAGSTLIEDDVVLAGQAGLAGHLRVGARARIAAQSGVIGDVAAGATVSGYPARPHREVLRHQAAVKRLAPLVRRLEEHYGERERDA